MIETISGIVAAVVIIILSRVLSAYFTTRLFAATVLVAIAFIYVGFSLKDNPVSSIVIESGIAILFYFLALIGYQKNSLLIAYGIILHGIWDISHHNGLFVKTDIPEYWPAFCLVVDIIDGLYFLFIFKNQKNKPAREHSR
jgi:hypothetical protein